MSTIVELRPAQRLLAPGGAAPSVDFDCHQRRHGPLDRRRSSTLLVELESSGLTGRGGGGFPAGRKAALARARRRRPILAVNVMEGEPASAKDALLLEREPHLILDGAEALAAALGASRIVLCVAADRNAAVGLLSVALRSRPRPAPGTHFELVRLGANYVGGEESALLDALAGGAGVPSFRPDKRVPLSLDHSPVVVHNAETLAHVALIARHGGAWFSSLGAPEAPGTCLVTVRGSVARPGVLEVVTGTPLSTILEPARPNEPIQAVLVGGYGGTFISHRHLGVGFAPSALHALGASMGAGILGAIGASSCGLAETARIVTWMAGESAGQCGPCVFGLPALAKDLRSLAAGRAGPEALIRLSTRCSSINGRGGCRHPDGVVRLERSALPVFDHDVRAHLAGRPCAAAHRAPLLPVPSTKPLAPEVSEANVTLRRRALQAVR